MTNDVCFYGLWQSASEIDEGLGRSSTEKNVFKQTHADKKIFTLSSKEPNGKYAKHSLDTLTTNVLKLVEAAGLRVTTEKNLPLLVGKRNIHLLMGLLIKARFFVLCQVSLIGIMYNMRMMKQSMYIT